MGFKTDIDAHRLCIDSVLVGVVLRHFEGLMQLIRAVFYVYTGKMGYMPIHLTVPALQGQCRTSPFSRPYSETSM